MRNRYVTDVPYAPHATYILTSSPQAGERNHQETLAAVEDVNAKTRAHVTDKTDEMSGQMVNLVTDTGKQITEVSLAV